MSDTFESQLWENSCISNYTENIESSVDTLNIDVYKGDSGFGMKILGSHTGDGVLIQELRVGGCAITAGLKEGDVLLEVNRCDMRGCTKDFAEELLVRLEPGHLTMKVYRPPSGDLNKTASLEDLIAELEEEEKRSPRSERKLEGFKKARIYRAERNLTTKDAVSLVPELSEF